MNLADAVQLYGTVIRVAISQITDCLSGKVASVRVKGPKSLAFEFLYNLMSFLRSNDRFIL